MRKELKQLFIDRLEAKGLGMSKRISSGGLFSSDTYDRRRPNSISGISELVNQGFTVDESAGMFMFNLFYNL